MKINTLYGDSFSVMEETSCCGSDPKRSLLAI
jgi:hypothetical protein